MNKQVKFQKHLLYMDGPLLFSAIDEPGNCYFGMLIDEDKGVYFCVQVSQERTDMFYKVQIDLRPIYEHPEVKEYYILKTIGENPFNFEIELIDGMKEAPEEYLPEPGLYLPEDER